MQTQTDLSQPVLCRASLQRSGRFGDRTLSVARMNHWDAEGANRWPYRALYR